MAPLIVAWILWSSKTLLDVKTDLAVIKVRINGDYNVSFEKTHAARDRELF